MKRRLFWKLTATFVIGAMLLFSLLHSLMRSTEQRMSYIDEVHQTTLRQYAAQAEIFLWLGQDWALARWLELVGEQEKTWVAVVRSELTPLAGSELSMQFNEGFRLGRSLEHKIHLYFKQNPIIELPFADKHTHFLITLPQRMRPGAHWFETSLLMQIGLPILLMGLLCVLIYRHLMSPLRQLDRAARDFSDGHFSVRLRDKLGGRHDELAAIAETFDEMADRIGKLIESQRHLTTCLSHELRTPLTRMELAVSQASLSQDCPQLQRVREECAEMRRMVEDTLTLAWLEREQPVLTGDSLDLTDLVDSIVSDARFEYPHHQLTTDLPDHCWLASTCQRALGRAIENIIRNALAHTPAGGCVSVTVRCRSQKCVIEVRDQGPGVPEAYLESIFQPFFRLAEGRGGYGVGLSLARREVELMGGHIMAVNTADGLLMRITLRH